MCAMNCTQQVNVWVYMRSLCNGWHNGSKSMWNLLYTKTRCQCEYFYTWARNFIHEIPAVVLWYWPSITDGFYIMALFQGDDGNSFVNFTHYCHKRTKKSYELNIYGWFIAKLWPIAAITVKFPTHEKLSRCHRVVEWKCCTDKTETMQIFVLNNFIKLWKCINESYSYRSRFVFRTIKEGKNVFIFFVTRQKGKTHWKEIVEITLYFLEDSLFYVSRYCIYFM